ncbi:MAG TPA: serine/threonine-protein kinase [Gemmatimonadales bacterium]|nr:serine/threonine-protein kinase [Gemmatimonadales bacterium]
MPESKRVIRRLRESSATLTSVAGSRGVPADLLRQASHRLQIMALVVGVLWVVGPALRHVALHAMTPADPRWSAFLPFDWVAAICCAVSFGLYWFLRSRERDPGMVMDLGLAFMVAVAFALGVLLHSGPLFGTATSVAPMITFVGPFMLMFAAVVPVPPWKMLAAGFVAACMDPLGMVIWKAAGIYQFGGMSDLLLMHYPNVLLLGMAVVISRVVNGLGQQVSRERALGSYRLGELLGSGGMGDVYLATHRMLARPAAIKLIRPEVLASSDEATAQLALTRFKREAEAAARLRSPHTVELYDFGVTENGTLYTVMELLEGMTLQALVRDHGPLPPARVVHILRQVCDSLQEAHVSGLVHRDIKPANIHVGRLGLRHDFVKVLDFGLVKSVEREPNPGLATEIGLTPGTPAYMAPEASGADAVDARADIYAVGCVAYYLLTGRLVFEGTSGLQVMARHLQEAPVPPSRRTEQYVPVELDHLVLACLAKEPADRPQTAAAIAAALEAMDLGSWSEADAAGWWSRHQAPAAAVEASDGMLAATGGML